MSRSIQFSIIYFWFPCHYFLSDIVKVIEHINVCNFDIRLVWQKDKCHTWWPRIGDQICNIFLKFGEITAFKIRKWQQTIRNSSLVLYSNPRPRSRNTKRSILCIVSFYIVPISCWSNEPVYIPLNLEQTWAIISVNQSWICPVLRWQVFNFTAKPSDYNLAALAGNSCYKKNSPNPIIACLA